MPPVTSKPVSIHASGPSLIVHLSPSVDGNIASSAQQEFPRAKFGEFKRMDGVPTTAVRPSVQGGIMVLNDPDADTLEKIRSERDDSGLPRWAVVIVASDGREGEFADLLDIIQVSELSVAKFRRVLRSAWDRQTLVRENVRLRGNLLTFGSRIAHDMRTPLGGVLTTTEMLREVLTDDAPADVPLTQPILGSTDGLVKVIERTSFFARASGSRDEPRAVDMGVPFWNAYQRLERAMLEAKVSLKHPADWPKVMGHESWLEAVWAILLNNAIQYSGSGAQMEAGWSAVENGRRFWVRSAGTVPVEKRESLFFPFHRLHESGAPRGLGLPMMRSFVELDGGFCGFQDGPAGGVDFFFVFPAGVDRENPPSAPRPAM